jgi:hypothetical protein
MLRSSRLRRIPIMLSSSVFYGVRRWTAPIAGDVDITGTVAAYDTTGGDGEEVEIRHGSALLWTQYLDAADSRVYPFTQTLAVEPGDAVDFIVGNGGAGDIEADWFSFAAEITLTPR